MWHGEQSLRPRGSLQIQVLCQSLPPLCQPCSSWSHLCRSSSSTGVSQASDILHGQEEQWHQSSSSQPAQPPEPHQNGHSHRPTGVRNKHRLCRYPGAEQCYKNDDVYFHGKIRKWSSCYVETKLQRPNISHLLWCTKTSHLGGEVGYFLLFFQTLKKSKHFQQQFSFN